MGRLPSSEGAGFRIEAACPRLSEPPGREGTRSGSRPAAPANRPRPVLLHDLPFREQGTDDYRFDDPHDLVAVLASSPALDGPQAPQPGMYMAFSDVVTLTIRPQPRSIVCGAASAAIM